MLNMIEFAGIAVAINMFTHWYSPIQGFKSKIVDKLPYWVGLPLICSKCAGFIFGLLWYQNLPMAALLSFSSYLIDNFIYFIERTK